MEQQLSIERVKARLADKEIIILYLEESNENQGRQIEELKKENDQLKLKISELEAKTVDSDKKS